ncbi:MAG TPA: hypothetical protein PK042_02465 [Usitatibacteraceae bacterium]|nr:hypothetical protein [Usitatibacteraceae bacterium]
MQEPENGDRKKEAETPPPTDRLSVTRHRARFGGRDLDYTVTCGTIVLVEESEKDGKAEADKPRASVFFVAYTADGAEPESRPLTFSFNGGPGSSSVWLHLGLLGPKRVELDDEGRAPPPPGRLVDNEHSLLEHSDLVFIDPVGTGYSRMVAGEKIAEYHEYKRDLESVGSFIRLYCSRYARWSSPRYLIGESYGTTRAAGLSGHLLERYGMYLNGLMLISCALDFTVLRFEANNDLPPVLFLPTYAATAWYHGRLAADLQAKELRAVLDEVEAFAGGEYAAALFRGDTLPAAERAKIAEKVARYTGLTAEYVERTGLRVEISRFCKELLRAKGRTTGRLDGRFTGTDRDSAGERFEFDPGFAEIFGAYASTMNDYVRRTLKFEADAPYEVLKGLYLNWGWKDFSNRYASVGETLRKALAMNPHMRVLVANGYYDFATPYFASDYTLDHLGVAPELRAKFSIGYYEAGHMMYVHKPSLERLAKELKAFVSSP